MLKLKSVAAAFLAAGFIISSLVSCSDGGSSGGSSAPVPKSLTVDASKAKKEFTAGEVFDIEGLEVQVVYSNNAQKDVTNFECTVPAENLTAEGKLQISDNSTRQDVEVTVTALGVTGSYHITIAAEPKSLKLSGTLTAKNYWVGDKFNASGLKVEAAYVEKPTDADYVDVTEYAEFDVSTEESGTKTVKAEYAGKEVSNGEISINVYKVEHSIESSCSTADEINKTVKVFLGKTDATENFTTDVTENGTSVETNLTKGTHTLTVSVTPKSDIADPVDIRDYTEKVEVFVTLPVEKIELEGLTDSTISLWKGDAVDTSNVKVKVTYVAADGAEAETETLALTASGVVVENLPDGTASGSSTVTVSYGGKNAQFTVSVYDITGADTLQTDGLKTDDSVPSLSGVKVVLDEEEVEGSEVALYKDDAKVEGSTFTSSGTYKVIAKVGTLTKVVKEFTVAENTEKKFNVTAGRFEGSAILITIDCKDAGLSWANDILNKSLTAELSSGTLSTGENQQPQFIQPTEADGVLQSYVAQIILTSPPASDIKVTISATIKGINYSAEVQFANGKYIPANYVPTAITISPATKTIAPGAEINFTAADTTYSVDYTDKVTWSIEGETAGCSIDKTGKFTAASDISTSTNVTVKATLKANTGVSTTASVTIDPSKVDTSAIYSVNFYNTSDKGAWGWCEITWTDTQYALSSIEDITNVKVADADVMQHFNYSSIEKGCKFQINTNGAGWRGNSSTLKFRVHNSTGYYDVTVAFTDSNVTENGSTTVIDSIDIADAVLNPQIKLASSTGEVLAGGSANVVLSYSEILDFNVENVSVSSSNESVATATFNSENMYVVISGVASGNATITVTYGSESVKAEYVVKVVDKLSEFTVKLDSAVSGAWINIYVKCNIEGDSIEVSKDSFSNISMNDINGDVFVGDPSSTADGVRFGYGFASADFQAGNHTLTFDVTTTKGDTYTVAVEFTGASGLETPFEIKSTTITPKVTEA
ncbi:MAG: hypothetical protein PUI24_08355 [Spirochaetales bacterium]|nr:hypothetical protein [Spirochaetales bacterium]